MKTQETLRILEKYVPKKLHGAIKEISKDIDGYDVVLNENWLFERNNTSFIAETIKELKQDLKNVEHFENEEYDNIMISLGNGPEKVKSEIIEIDDNEDYVDPIQVIVEVEEIEEDEETEEKLVKVENEMFNEYFVGQRSGYIQNLGYIERKVICILDNNCVRYSIIENGKSKRKSHFDNDNKKLCFKNAECVLNKGFVN